MTAVAVPGRPTGGDRIGLREHKPVDRMAIAMSVAITSHVWTKVTCPDQTTLWVWHNAGHTVLVEFDQDASLLLPRGGWRWQARATPPPGFPTEQ